MNLRQIDFPFSQYIREEHQKKQIYLHHTAGNPNGVGTFGWWQSNPERVATCVAISGKGNNCVDGEIIQGFSSRYWAYHLGIKPITFKGFNLPVLQLDKISIGIEICNWGQLSEVNGKFYTYTGKEINQDEVIELDNPYKGFRYFHSYTEKQINSVRDLLLLWNNKYGITLDYNEDIWKVCPRALRGENGVFTHNSVRVDKVDIYPHPLMIQMLKSL
jgi:N-acetyl-anhydromuramyl-L-alanine amidase AmpD